MKNNFNHPKYSRCGIINFSKISNIVSKNFIDLTNEIFLGINRKTTLHLLDEKCKNIKIIDYFNVFNNEKKNIEKILLYFLNETDLKYIIKYSNPKLYNRLIYLVKENKLTSKEYTTINSYLNRSTYNPVYSGFTSFYSSLEIINKGKYLMYHNNIDLELIEEKDTLLINNKKKNCYFLNTTSTLVDDKKGLIFYISNLIEENIVHLKSFGMLYNLLGDKVFYDKKQLILFISNGLSLTINKVETLVNEFINIGLIIYSYKFNNFNFLNGISSRKSNYFRGNINLNKKNIYDILNKNKIIVDQRMYSDFGNQIGLYEYFLGGQLKKIGKELDYIRNKSQIKNNEKIPILIFIKNNFNLITEIFNKRETYSSDFENKIIDTINNYKGNDIIILDDFRNTNKILKNGTEIFFSTTQIESNNYFIIENIAPLKVFSSRYEYLIGKETRYPIKNGNKVLIEVLMNPGDGIYHSFRRNTNINRYLNINLKVNYNQNNLNINDVYIYNNDGKLELYDNKNNLFLEPIITSTVSLNKNIVARFIKLFSGIQKEIYKLPKVLPGVNNNRDFLPRIIIDKLIITKKIWLIKTDEINVIKKSHMSYGEYLYIIKFLKQKGIPRYVNIFNKKNMEAKPIDIYNFYSCINLKKYYNEEVLYIEEMLPSPDYPGYYDKINDHILQFNYIVGEQ